MFNSQQTGVLEADKVSWSLPEHGEERLPMLLRELLKLRRLLIKKKHSHFLQG